MSGAGKPPARSTPSPPRPQVAPGDRHLFLSCVFCHVLSSRSSSRRGETGRRIWLSQSALSLCECSGRGFLTPLSREPAGSEGSHNNGVCTAFLFQMYIALISLHALIMVGFHFLHCFEEDWTSEYVPGPPLLLPGPVYDPGGLGSWLVSWCQGPTPFY